MNAAGRLECSLHGGVADASGWVECSLTACGHAPVSEARTDRRQRAREAYYDACGPGRPEGSAIALEAGIETATRVRVDADVTQAVRNAYPDIMVRGKELKGVIEVAFRAAGFEVEQ